MQIAVPGVRMLARSLCAALLFLLCRHADAAPENIRIALLDPLSGTMALQGESVSHQLHAAMEEINAQGGVLGGATFEVVDFDDKLSPQEALAALQSAVDRGIRYVTQGLRVQGDTGALRMRADDHQIVHALYVATLARAGSRGVAQDWEGTGYGWRADARIEVDRIDPPTTCSMVRPRS